MWNFFTELIKYSYMVSRLWFFALFSSYFTLQLKISEILNVSVKTKCFSHSSTPIKFNHLTSRSKTPNTCSLSFSTLHQQRYDFVFAFMYENINTRGEQAGKKFVKQRRKLRKCPHKNFLNDIF